jgi:hypothetical protein
VQPCGYTGAERDFTEEADVTPVVREHVWTELAPQLTAAPNRGAVPRLGEVRGGAKVAEWQGLEPRHVADLLLRAAWCCVDEGDVEAERFFRRKAAWAFERALDAFDGVAREERAVLTYLVGELWRRVGDQGPRASGSTACPARWSTRPRSSGCSTRAPAARLPARVVRADDGPRVALRTRAATRRGRRRPARERAGPARPIGPPSRPSRRAPPVRDAAVRDAGRATPRAGPRSPRPEQPVARVAEPRAGCSPAR